MPASTRYSRSSISGSPPLSFSPSISHTTTVGPQKLNIVTRVVIEGRAERGANGAAIKMYLKVSNTQPATVCIREWVYLMLLATRSRCLWTVSRLEQQSRYFQVRLLSCHANAIMT